VKHRVLIVEDNAANRELLSDWLEAEGYDVLTAADLKTAFSAVENQHPHAVLLDVQLGADDGLQLAHWMRRQARFQHLPVIAVTAHAMVAEESRILQAGCNGYVPKPIDFRQLRESLERCVAASGMASSPD